MVHLELETAFGFRASTLTPQQAAALAVNSGFQAAAITDFHTMHAAIPFYRACLQKNIKPIFGLKAMIQSKENLSFLLLLYAENNKGFSNLIKISSALQTKAQNGLPLKWLDGYAEGLTAVLPGAEGDTSPEAIKHFSALFPHFYMGLRGQKPEDELLEKAKQHNLPVVALSNVQYAKQSSAFASICLQAIRENRQLTPEDELPGNTYAFLSKEELTERFKHVPEAIAHTAEIAGRCSVSLQFGEQRLPAFPLPGGQSADSYLKKLCQKALAGSSDLYKNRLDYELSVIQKMGFSDYFLIVHDFVQYAKKKGILVGPGRGSAAGSLVAYLLGITAVDPIKFNLLFERFLNPDRVTMPDIDIDFPDHRREEVIKYIVSKYGQLHAAQIVTFGTLTAKAVMRDTARVFGLETGALARLSGLIPSAGGIQLKDVDLNAWRAESPVHERIYLTALQLEGLPRHTSTHAAGIVLSEQPLTNSIPVMAGHDHVYLTQYSMEELEALGLLKIDLLGLRNLTVIEKIIQSIQKTENKLICLEDLPLDDQQVFTLLSKGQTNGIFQFESEGIKKALMDLQPQRFEDMVAVNALYRPGPMSQIPLFIKRRHGQEQVRYIHPSLKEILEPTYGIIVYQEQIIQIAVKMADFTPGQADLLRRAVSKKNKETIEQKRRSFMEGAERQGVERAAAAKVYEWIVQFADYGFNRSHAVAYSLIAYWLAWLKTHYPAHFMAAQLTSFSGNSVKIQQYIQEAKQQEIVFFAPSVNQSYFSFQARKNGVSFGLTSVKGVGQPAAKAIIENRKLSGYKNLFDFCLRVPRAIVSRQAIESLIYAGAMDEFGQDRAVLLASIDKALEQADLFEPDEANMLEGLGVSSQPRYAAADDMPVLLKLEKEKETLGVYLSAHPLASYRQELTKAGIQKLSDLQVQKRVTLAGIIGDVREIRTKKGEKMAFAHLTDETSERELVLFPEVYRKYRSLFEKEMFVLLTGAAEERRGSFQIIVQAAEKLESGIRHLLEENQTLYIKLPERSGESELSVRLYELIGQFPGNTPVVLYYERTKETVKLNAKYRIAPKEALMAQLKKECGTENVILQASK